MVNRRDALRLGAGTAVGAGLASALVAANQEREQQTTTTAETTTEQETTPEPGPEGDVSTSFVTGLTGSQQPDPVETDAEGAVYFALEEEGENLEFSLAMNEIRNVTQAHIHLGSVGESGPIVVWLVPDVEAREPDPSAGPFYGEFESGTIEAENFVGPLEGEPMDALVAEILAGNAYVNVHTEQNPDGEIRGQLLSAGQFGELLASAKTLPTTTRRAETTTERAEATTTEDETATTTTTTTTTAESDPTTTP